MAIITISRGSLCGGAQLAEQLGQRLGAKVLSREVIVETAKKYGVSEKELNEGLSTPPGLWDRLTHHRQRYILAIQATLADLVVDGNVIYHGHGGQFLLKNLSKVIKLRLIAPTPYRVRAAVAELGLTEEEAVKHIQMVDDQRAKWVRLLYNVEWADPSLYDMVVNLEHISIETACELVADLVGRKEYRRDADALQERQDFALAARVNAELTFHSDFPDGAVEVSVRRGAMKVSGGPFYEKHQEQVLSFIREIPGAADALDEGEVGVSDGRKVESREPTAGEMMLPIKDYPFVRQSVSIREATGALATSTVKLLDDHFIRPRYILVQDDMDRLVGVVARRSLLTGLTPQLRQLKQMKEKSAAMGAPVGDFSFPLTFKWHSLFSPSALAAANDSVESVMSPIRCTVSPEDSLSVVVSTMLEHEVDLMPVVEGRKPVGVIIMTEVFDSVAQYVLERGGTPRETSGK